MNKTTTIATIIAILVTIIVVASRQIGKGPDGEDSRTGNRADGIAAGPASKSTDSRMSSKSGDRVPSEKPKVITTDSGLQYEVLVEGSGPTPGPTDTVKVHYHGTKLDGEVFDSSVDRGRPTSFPLNRVIKGWSEGLQLMSAGGKFRFTIPPELAYGERGAGSKIGPNETLVFEVELLEITPAR